MGCASNVCLHYDLLSYSKRNFDQALKNKKKHCPVFMLECQRKFITYQDKHLMTRISKESVVQLKIKGYYRIEFSFELGKISKQGNWILCKYWLDKCLNKDNLISVSISTFSTVWNFTFVSHWYGLYKMWLTLILF